MNKVVFLTTVFLLTIWSCKPIMLNNNQSKVKPTILFVCEHGAARSTIAAAYFNKLAQEQGLNYQAVFRGTSPDSVLTMGTKKGLIEDGFDVTSWKPLMVTSKDISTASQVVTFDCTLPSMETVKKPISQWNGIPPISKDYKAARNEIVGKVKELLSELAKQK
jgi:arsenate reductase (thioredoxin)